MNSAFARRAPSGFAAIRGVADAFVRPKTLDRYMMAELVGPSVLGLTAFTLIFASVNILAISKLVGEEHAPLYLAISYFLWQMPQIILTVLPAAMLLGTLLSLQRLSTESEITALKAGGIGLVRCVAPLLVVGVIVSLCAYVIQEAVVPFANDRAAYVRDDAIRHVGAFGGGSHTVVTNLPGGGQQVTYFRGYDPSSQSLLNVTIVTYGIDNQPKNILFSERGVYAPPRWSFTNATVYHFGGDGTTESHEPNATIDVGERPNQIQRQVLDNNRETMSRSQIREAIDSHQLSAPETRAYESSYEGKLARPFMSFVFTLIAVPFGLRPPRGGGGTGAGFGLAFPIAFVYFVVMSVSSAVATDIPGGYEIVVLGAWLPNIIFTAIGIAMLRRAARY